MKIRIINAWALLLPLVLVGCGSDENRLETVSLEGKLFLDGKPYSGPAWLSLRPTTQTKQGRGATAKVADDGTFTLTTYEVGDGVIPGKYNAILVPDEMKMNPVPQTKPFPVTIPKEGSAELEIKLETIPGSQPSLPGMGM